MSYLFMIGDLSIQFVVHAGHHEISVQYWLLCGHVLPFLGKRGLCLFTDEIREPITVFIIDQTVLEDSLFFMVPQT